MYDVRYIEDLKVVFFEKVQGIGVSYIKIFYKKREIDVGVNFYIYNWWKCNMGYYE